MVIQSSIIKKSEETLRLLLGSQMTSFLYPALSHTFYHFRSLSLKVFHRVCNLHSLCEVPDVAIDDVV